MLIYMHTHLVTHMQMHGSHTTIRFARGSRVGPQLPLGPLIFAVDIRGLADSLKIIVHSPTSNDSIIIVIVFIAPIDYLR